MAVDAEREVEREVARVLDELAMAKVDQGKTLTAIGNKAALDRSDVAKLLNGNYEKRVGLQVLARLARALGYQLKLVLRGGAE